MTVSAVWTLADIFNGLMAFPNLIALFVLSGVVANETKKYFDKQKGLINIRIKDVGDFIQVEIEDNGKGIGAKELQYIFDRFYR